MEDTLNEEVDIEIFIHCNKRANIVLGVLHVKIHVTIHCQICLILSEHK
jgi:hypothetical protein